MGKIPYWLKWGIAGLILFIVIWNVFYAPFNKFLSSSQVVPQYESIIRLPSGLFSVVMFFLTLPIGIIGILTFCQPAGCDFGARLIILISSTIFWTLFFATIGYVYGVLKDRKKA